MTFELQAELHLPASSMPALTLTGNTLTGKTEYPTPVMASVFSGELLPVVASAINTKTVI